MTDHLYISPDDFPYDSFRATFLLQSSADLWCEGLYNQGFIVAVRKVEHAGKTYYRCGAWSNVRDIRQG